MNLSNGKQQNQNNNSHLLEACSISFEYSNSDTRRALNHVSFFVDYGERIAILGHNGSGKSTLVKILGALQNPTEGKCLIKGRNIQNLDLKELRSTIGMVFQDPENQIVAAMVQDDIAFSPENQGLPSDEIQKRVDKALNAVGLDYKKNASVQELSGGEKQRLAIAGALASEAECLILDEPTAMLDPNGRLEVEKALRKIHSDGTAIIQVTHQIENFDDIQRILVLSHGEILWQGNFKEFIANSEKLGFALPDKYKIGEINIKNIAEKFKPIDKFHDDNQNLNGQDIFKIKNLYFSFNESKPALENINAVVKKAQWTSIIGRTGSGKSTLIQHLNALYKIQQGEIIFNDLPLPQKGKELHELRQKVGMVFQHPEEQLFSVDVREELAFAPKNAGFSKSETDDAIIYALDCVGLEKFLTRNPIALSGGERRLVAIASVLSSKPDCIILDEPLAGLDAKYQKKILALLKNLRNSGKTIITITHDLNIALSYSDEILILRNAKFVQEDTPCKVLKTLTEVLQPEVLPDVLKISSEINKLNKDFPLVYDYNEFLKCISQI